MVSPTGAANDTRGWIMCVISAIACVAGACIVCVDVFIRLIPGKKNFSIQDSSAFLSCSLSLSFGVMIFSSLFSMLPSSKRYLSEDGATDQAAGFSMMAGFAGGFVGMQVISRIIHRFMPSHVVDCDHSHEEEPADGDRGAHSRHHSHTTSHSHSHSHQHHAHLHSPFSRGIFHSRSQPHAGTVASESTPLLHSIDGAHSEPPAPQRQLSSRSDGAAAAITHGEHQSPMISRPNDRIIPGTRPVPNVRRPSMIEVRKRVISFVKDVKMNCDDLGPCYGYTDPCGQECKRNISGRAPGFLRNLPHVLRQSTSSTLPASRATDEHLSDPVWETTHHSTVPAVPEETNSDNGNKYVDRSISPGTTDRVLRPRGHDPRDHVEMQEGDPEAYCPASASANGGESSTNVSNSEELDSNQKGAVHSPEHSHSHGHHHCSPEHEQSHDHVIGSSGEDEGDLEAGAATSGAQQQHHHHVPTNAFLSIGLQTVLAIGLHKFPEGFITFATNHANPALGFNVFMALFVHNIAEGFAMALPLYMALGSRLRAILWSAALGGLSQPVGAGVAALWLRYLSRDGGSSDGKSSDSENGTAYGVLFAVTAGIMVSVALQLFVESLTLHHNRQLSIGFAFMGMMLLGLSNALGAH